jgi:hypothetical protein
MKQNTKFDVFSWYRKESVEFTEEEW